jgi:hypothetical protein
LNKNQLAEVDRLLKETGTDVTRFLSWAGAKSRETVPARRYQEALDFLHQKQRSVKQ